MSLTLGIESSSLPFKVVFGENGALIYNSQDEPACADLKDVALLVVKGLESLGRSVSDIDAICVNIGPGGTSMVRTGVAFVNGLSYSLKVPVYPLNAFELSGLEAWDRFKMPIICTANSLKDHAYVGLFNNGALELMKYGVLFEVLTEILADIPAFAVAGFHRQKIVDFFSNKTVHDTGIQTGNPGILIEKMAYFADRAVYFPDFVSPLTEQSAVFV